MKAETNNPFVTAYFAINYNQASVVNSGTNAQTSCLCCSHHCPDWQLHSLRPKPTERAVSTACSFCDKVHRHRTLLHIGEEGCASSRISICFTHQKVRRLENGRTFFEQTIVKNGRVAFKFLAQRRVVGPKPFEMTVANS